MRHVDALKVFCWERNLKVSGTKTDLVALVLAASEMEGRKNLKDTQRKLQTSADT